MLKDDIDKCIMNEDIMQKIPKVARKEFPTSGLHCKEHSSKKAHLYHSLNPLSAIIMALLLVFW